MMRWMALLLAPACAAAEKKPAPLPDFAPSFMKVVDLNAHPGQVLLRSYQIEEQNVQTLSTGAGGTTLTEERVVGPSRKDRYLAVKDCKFVEASGKAIKPADLARRLKAGTAVVLTSDGKPPSKAFLALLRPETIIVIAPAAKLDPRIKLPPEDDKRAAK